MEEDRVLKRRLVLKKKVKRCISQTLLSIILLLLGLIVGKTHPTFMDMVEKKVYEDSFEFVKARQLYDTYLGSFVPFSGILKEEQAVFSENISYKGQSSYMDGVKLEVSSSYIVPALQEGIVVFIGEKEGYGNTIIVEQTDGVDVFYGNISNLNVNLYDYIEKGTPIGEVVDNTLYLVFQKEGQVIDYKNYI